MIFVYERLTKQLYISYANFLVEGQIRGKKGCEV